jgi:predicted nucleic-acid-binding protein
LTGLSRHQQRLLRASTLVVERERSVFAAMFALRKGHGSFADALIADLGARAGCYQTLTLDRQATNLPGFALP